ncbi:MAG: MBL fold metallo-hydrolase [Candidatus Micrarchaeaceae archaeon]
MEIQFLGGASEVGRSGFLIKDSQNILLDYGIKPEKKVATPLSPSKVDALIISHAHLDHCGNAPYLLKYFSLPSFGTDPTIDLAELLIKDSIKLNKRNHTGLRYSGRELRIFEKKYIPYKYHEKIDFGNYEFEFFDAGHIAGSAIVEIEKKSTGKKLVYTGDFKIAPQYLHYGAEIVRGDILIIESTYANTVHPNREERIKRLIEEINETIENGGTVLLPVFAVGRAQELLIALYKNRLSNITFIDGMAKAATERILRHGEYISSSQELYRASMSVRWIERGIERETALNGGNIILTTAGMLNGGPALNYITRLNQESKIILTGYQVEGTNGRNLLEGKPIEVNGRKVKINTPVSYYDLSAHAGQDDLHEYIKKSNPETVICIHGEERNTNMLAEWVREEMEIKAYAPKVGESIKIDF